MGLPIRRLILATNENDVLDEFFRTGRYRPRATAETHATSSPSMDISKASNFERYVFDIVGRDAGVVRELWRRLDTEGGFDLAGTPYWPRVAASGFVSGMSTHADRLATIRDAFARCGVWSIRTPPTASRSGASIAMPACRWSASRPRCRRSSRRRSARRSAAIRSVPRPTPISSRGRSAATVLPADVGAGEGVHRGARRGAA